MSGPHTTPRTKPRLDTADEFMARCLASGNYRVDESARVWNLNYRSRGGTAREIVPHVSNGYWRVGLRDNGEYRLVYVHRLVAAVFLGPLTADRSVVNHINGDKRDARPANLEWVSSAENNEHAWRTELATKPPPRYTGEAHPMAKLTAQAVASIRSRVAAGEARKAVAAELGLSHQYVINLCLPRQRTWRTTGAANESA